ncbi:hypothetical protein Pmani_036459 [Petrolisthes manimaculis]|uniref:Protein SHQ1 homolog n=1 Tax=Petrolisthes manimaculis TaxID=1843537 RepID=A0AAE1TPD1_9EUCA|nr:hypothetical protein Pmani_036459 [Petrolisthes manimaculis]
MLTPKFEVKQDDASLTVKIFAPYAQISDAEVNIDGDTFTFYSSPYYLRLTFSGKLMDSELEQHSAKFDADVGAFIIVCQKESQGQHFPNLDMLTALLTPHGATGVNIPSIEVVGGDEAEDEEGEGEFDWTYQQKLPDENVVTAGHKYGFANKLTGVFTSLQDELKGVVDISDPDNKSAAQRREERVAHELSAFDEDHYLADYFEVDTATQCVEFIPEFYSITSDEVELKESEQEALLRLPRKEHLLDPGSRSAVYLGLVDLLYAWAYNHRVTLGENCVESAWNVSKISATLSWLDSFTQLKDVAVSCVRRSLTFPLVRNWHLSQQVLKDTIQLLLLGQKKVLQCLLEIHSFFNQSEPRYLLNQLYITDYCVWIQKVKDNKLISLADSLKKIKVNKTDLQLDLEELEAAALLVLEEEDDHEAGDEANINKLAQDMTGLTIIENGAALGANDNQEEILTIESNNQRQGEIPVVPPVNDDSDSSSSESDSDSEDDSDSSSDSSEDSSEDEDDNNKEEDSSSDSSDLDSDDDTLSDTENA